MMHDDITQAYIAMIMAERDEAVEHAGELELDLQQANESIAILTAQLRMLKQDRTYEVA